MTITFKTTLKQTGGNTTGIVVPPEIVEKLGGGKKPAVNVTVNGFAYRSSIASMGGEFLVGVSAERRAAAGVKGGDAITVTLALDTAPREVEIPPDFARALAANKAAKAAFDKLSYSHKSQHVLAITGAKAAETRARRIDKAIAMLTED